MMLFYGALIFYQSFMMLSILPFLLFFYFHDSGTKRGYLMRLGLIDPPKSFQYWCHCASVGELKALLQVLNHLPKEEVFITVMNYRAFKIAQQNFGSEQVAYSPIDFYPLLRIFLSRLKPTVYICSESEIWPCQLYLLKSLQISTYLVNAGLSSTSFKRYQLFPMLAQNILSSFRRIFCRSKIHKQRFSELTNRGVAITCHSNLKFDAELIEKSLPSFVQQQTFVKALAHGRRILVAGSSHKEDEHYLFKALASPRMLSLYCPIIVPRDPERAVQIEITARKFGFDTVTLSQSNHLEICSDRNSILIVDCFGILMHLYQLADICFVGGSFTQAGCHSPIEPASLGKPVVIGPHYQNIIEIVEYLTEKNALEIVSNHPGSLLETLESLSDEDLKAMGQRALYAADSAKGSGSEIAKQILLDVGALELVQVN